MTIAPATAAGRRRSAGRDGGAPTRKAERAPAPRAAASGRAVGLRPASSSRADTLHARVAAAQAHGRRAGAARTSGRGARPTSPRPTGARGGTARVAARPAAPRPAAPRASAGPVVRRARAMRAARPAAGGAATLSDRIAAAAAAAVALPARTPAPVAPPRRRPSAVPPPRADRPRRTGVLAWLGALPDHPLLDRLIGGRIWIVLIGTLLVGLVTLQVSLLKLNAGIGDAVERSTELTAQNAALRAQVSRLSDAERIAELAGTMGLVFPPQGSPRFVTADADDPVTALRTMRVPVDPATATAAPATGDDATAGGAASADAASTSTGTAPTP